MLRDIITAIVTWMSQTVAFMDSIGFEYGGFHFSLWDAEISFLVLSVILMVALPHFDGGDDD